MFDKLLNIMTQIMSKTTLGKWSVWLNAFFLISMIISIILVKILRVLSFDDHWWDVTVPITFLASIIAFILGLIAIKKYRENSALVYTSIAINILLILFIIFHSLFIND
jgi:hypothetical protein